MTAGKERHRQVVKLSTIKPQGMLVDIDGETYEAVPPSWWGVEQARSVRLPLKVINDFETKMQDFESEDGPNDNDVAEYRHALVTFCQRIIPDAPVDKIKQLPDAELQTLVQVFLQALRERRAQASATQQTNPTGPTSSAISADTTQE